MLRQAPDCLNCCIQGLKGVAKTAVREGRQTPQTISGPMELGASLVDNRFAFHND